MKIVQPSLFDLPVDLPAIPDEPSDGAARAFATDPANHVVLEASAGTGKTRVLVDRYVRLIGAGVDPQHILAMTFTRKAASEMRDRILQELEHQAGQTRQMAERWTAIRERVADVNISTIDAFCFSLLREFPLEADVDPAFEIADETEVPRFVNEAVELALRASRLAWEADEHLRLLFARVSRPQIRQALAQLLDRRHVAGPAIATFVQQHVRYTSVDEACVAFIDEVRRLFESPRTLDGFLRDGPVTAPEFQRLARDLEMAATFPTNDHAAVRRFMRGLEAYFTRDNAPRRQAARKFAGCFPSPMAKRRHEAIFTAVARGVLPAIVRFKQALNGELARGLQRLFVMTCRQYEALLADHAVLDFPAMLEYSVRLLDRQEEFARSRLKLQSRYQHVLVDEFQDTSRLQWRLIELLVHAWGEGEGPTDTPPSIFIVGDRKQSIYRFRNAEVTLLDEAASFITRLRPQPKTREAIQHSYRAVPELLAFINAVSEKLQHPSTLPDRFEYRSTDRFPTPAVEPGARREGEPVLGLAVAASASACAEIVASEIERLLAANTTIRAREGPPRALKPEDIAILFRTRAGHREFETALEHRGIPTYVYKGLGFFDAAEVLDLQVLIRFLAQPESDLRAAEFLRSRFVRLSDDGLAKLAPGISSALTGSADASRDAQLGAADLTLLTLVRQHAARWLGLVDRVPPAELIDRVIRDSAYIFEARGPRLSQARENLKKVRALIRRVQNRGYTTLGRLADYFETLSAGEESNAIVAARGRIQLMTVHAAKGLEFPIVFLVRLNAGASAVPPMIGVVPNGRDGQPDVAIGIRSDAKKLEIERDEEEQRRLLYVALTRARDRLYLAAEVEDGQIKKGRTSLASLLPASLRATLSEAASRTGEAEWVAGDGQSFAFRICQGTPVRSAASSKGSGLELTYVNSRPDPGAIRTAVTASANSMPESPADAATSLVGESHPILGTLVHRLFQQRADPSRPVADLARQARRLLRSSELTEVEDAAALSAKAAELFVRLRQNPGIAGLLEAGQCHYEVPFSFAPAGTVDQILRGSIDCVVMQPSGVVTVLEFKTGTPRPEHDTQAAIYVAALQAAMPDRTVQAKVIYP